MKPILKLIPAFAIFAAACATNAPPPPEASLTFQSAAICSASLDAAAAKPITLEGPTGQLYTPVVISAAESPCLTGDGTARPYALLRLPDAANLASINAGSLLEARRVFASDILLLNADMTVSRQLGPEAFRHRGRTWSVLVRPQPGETYLAIIANPELVGTRFAYIVNPEPEETPLDARGPSYYLPYSYEGTVFVRLFFHDPATLAP